MIAWHVFWNFGSICGIMAYFGLLFHRGKRNKHNAE